MRALRALLGGLLWILAAVLGLLGGILSVTIILLPVGIPLIWLSKKVFGQATALMLPRAVRHPVRETGRTGRRTGRAGRKATRAAGTKGKELAKGLGRESKAAEKSLRRAGTKGRKAARRQRKRLRQRLA